jgi:hypothetical protein
LAAADRFSVFCLPHLLPITVRNFSFCSYEARGLPFPAGVAVHPPRPFVKGVSKVIVTDHGVMRDPFSFDFITKTFFAAMGINTAPSRSGWSDNCLSYENDHKVRGLDFEEIHPKNNFFCFRE